MNTRPIPRRSRVGAALIFGAAALTGCDFIESTALDPNAVPSATLDQLFTGVQVNTFYVSESQIARLAAMWTQQMAGTDRQFATLDQYIFTEEEADGEFNSIYGGGGLIDIRNGILLAEDQGRTTYAAILKIHEAYLMGMAASVFGALPYSEAVDPDVTDPALDDQLAIYGMVQTRLDEAIAELQGGTGSGPGLVDLNFGGDVAAWTAVAWTLKARFYLHTAEVDGQPAYQAALQAAQNGIMDPSNNWTTVHSTAATEQNLWYQFQRDRSGYISAGDYLIPLMIAENDPRLPFYYSAVDGNILPRQSGLSELGYGGRDFNIPIVTCAENEYIRAEALYETGDEAGARSAAESGLACQEQRWDVDLSGYVDNLAGVTGADLLEEIIEQKYTALFLNIEVWNDYKRTCYPAITPKAAGGVPTRLFYGQTERQTNSNIPIPANQQDRNENDPNPC